MPSRETLVICARSIAHQYKGVQPNGTFPSWETLKAVHDQAMLTPPDWQTHNGANLTALKQGKWLRKDGVPAGHLTRTWEFPGAASSKPTSCNVAAFP